MIVSGRMAAARVTGSAVVMQAGVVLSVHQVVTLAGQQRHDETAGWISRHRRQDVVIIGRVHHHRIGDVGRGDGRRSVVMVPVKPKPEEKNEDSRYDCIIRFRLGSIIRFCVVQERGFRQGDEHTNESRAFGIPSD